MRARTGSLTAALATLAFWTALDGAVAALRVHVDLSEQTMVVRSNGRVAHVWLVSTGRKGYATPQGRFRPIRLERMWYSRKYDMTPMPHSIFFLGGYAIHGTREIARLGRRASHGCVRLHPRNARRLYDLVRRHGRNATTIVVAP